MYIIKTTQQTARGPEDKFILSIADGNPSYTSKEMLAMRFSEQDANIALMELSANIAKTFTKVEVQE